MKIRLLSSLFIAFILFSCGTESDSTNTYSLKTSASPVEGGTLLPSNGEFEEGELIELKGVPNNGYLFSKWEGDWSSTENPTSVTMNSNRNIIGVFVRRNYPLNISIEGRGTVEERIVSQSKTTDYPFETVVELTPIPDPGWEFEEWSGDVSSTVEVIELTIDGEKNITVKFTDSVFLGENGVTIMCPDGHVGDIGVVNGVEYEIVDRNLLIQRKDQGKDLTKVCVSLITDMSLIFDRSTFNQNIETWDVSSVTNMSGMFRDSPFNQPIETWDVSSVTDMGEMFRESPFNQSIGNWDVSSVTDMNGMFVESSFNQNISGWCVSNISSEPSSFSDSSPLNEENKPVWGTCPD